VYESIDEIWPDYPTKEDFFFNEDEYWSIFRFNFSNAVSKGLRFLFDIKSKVVNQ
jgi:hypothetical protein